MATPNYNLPTISGNMTVDVVRDMNALATATDGAIKLAMESVDMTQIEQSITATDKRITTHLEDKANPHGVTASQVGAVSILDFDVHKSESATLTSKGHTQLSNAIDSTSVSLAATPSAVKNAYDRGNAAFNNEVELRAEFNAFKSALTEGFTSNQFSDGLTSLDAFNVTAGYYNLPMTRLEV